MIKELDTYDWEQAFEYGSNPEAVPGDKVSVEPILRENITKLIGIEEGEPDEAPWCIAGKLNDGRWFYLTAGCDYSGWD
jgi:hypothetical protein